MDHAEPHPDIMAVVLAWWITFTVICTINLVIGFGPAGVIAGGIPNLRAHSSFLRAANIVETQELPRPLFSHSCMAVSRPQEVSSLPDKHGHGGHAGASVLCYLPTDCLSCSSNGLGVRCGEVIVIIEGPNTLLYLPRHLGSHQRGL